MQLVDPPVPLFFPTMNEETTEKTSEDKETNAEEYSHNLSKYEQLCDRITQLIEKKNDLESKIEELMSNLLRVSHYIGIKEFINTEQNNDKKYASSIESQLESLHHDLLETENDFHTKSVALLKLKSAWRFEIYKSITQGETSSRYFTIQF